MNQDMMMVDLAWLRLADYNPREMPAEEMRKLVRSIREFGFVQPVVARYEDGLIVGGHQRVAAMRIMLREDGTPEGDVKVPAVLVHGLSDERAKVLNLALNRISGEWDQVKLSAVIGDLMKVPTVDLALTGFAPDEIGALMDSALEGIDAAAAPAGIDSTKDSGPGSIRFTFRVAPEHEELVKKVLTRYGMTGPKDASDAFVKVVRAAGRSPSKSKKKRPTAAAAS